MADLDPLSPATPGAQTASLPEIPKEKPDFDFFAKLNDDSDVWSSYTKLAQQQDEEMLIRHTRNLDALLVFSGLFSAVLTAFIIESYQEMRPDTSESSLEAILKIMEAMHTGSTAPIEMAPDQSTRATIVVVNCLWFVGLMCTLGTSLVCLLLKQLLEGYLRGLQLSSTPRNQALRRQRRHEIMETWHVSETIEIIPNFLHGALGLFFVGMVIFLWEINSTVAGLTFAVGTLFTIAYAVTMVAPVVLPGSTPFRSRLLLGWVQKARNLSVLRRSRVVLSHVRHFISTIRHPADIVDRLERDCLNGLEAGRNVSPHDDVKIVKPDQLERRTERLDIEKRGSTLETAAILWIIANSQDPTAVDTALAAFGGLSLSVYSSEYAQICNPEVVLLLIYRACTPDPRPGCTGRWIWTPQSLPYMRGILYILRQMVDYPAFNPEAPADGNPDVGGEVVLRRGFNRRMRMRHLDSVFAAKLMGLSGLHEDVSPTFSGLVTRLERTSPRFSDAGEDHTLHMALHTAILANSRRLARSDMDSSYMGKLTFTLRNTINSSGNVAALWVTMESIIHAHVDLNTWLSGTDDCATHKTRFRRYCVGCLINELIALAASPAWEDVRIQQQTLLLLELVRLPMDERCRCIQNASLQVVDENRSHRAHAGLCTLLSHLQKHGLLAMQLSRHHKHQLLSYLIAQEIDPPLPKEATLHLLDIFNTLAVESPSLCPYILQFVQIAQFPDVNPHDRAEVFQNFCKIAEAIPEGDTHAGAAARIAVLRQMSMYRFYESSQGHPFDPHAPLCRVFLANLSSPDFTVRQTALSCLAGQLLGSVQARNACHAAIAYSDPAVEQIEVVFSETFENAMDGKDAEREAHTLEEWQRALTAATQTQTPSPLVPRVSVVAPSDSGFSEDEGGLGYVGIAVALAGIGIHPSNSSIQTFVSRPSRLRVDL